jgi:metal-responsive CopG/Arc/MetJ family transcriptional regulator
MSRHEEGLQRALDGMGNTHLLKDILAALEDGSMQSFAQGDTWVVTQVIEFPQKRVLEVFLVVGDGADLAALSDTITAFAQFQRCKLIRAYGRPGWLKHAKPLGWCETSRIFLREI